LLTITVISPSNASVGAAPGGLGYLAEMLEAGNLRDELSVRQLPDGWLFPSLARLRRKYRGRLRTRWVNPYSLLGLYLAVRFRIRAYPTIMLDREILDSVGGASEFEALVAARLAAVEA
jgi:hypothetical protein